MKRGKEREKLAVVESESGGREKKKKKKRGLLRPSLSASFALNYLHPDRESLSPSVEIQYKCWASLLHCLRLLPSLRNPSFR